ncbi:jg25960, partial [Pararge aegeria aegeria]
ESLKSIPVLITHYSLRPSTRIAAAWWVCAIKPSVYTKQILQNVILYARFTPTRRRPPLLAVPRGRTNLLNKAPLTRAIRTLNDIAERTDLFCCNLTELTKVALSCTCYSGKV